jgi:hypothetical protein
MKIRYLNLVHDKCNNALVVPMFIGLTDEYCLVVEGYCSKCGVAMVNKMTLEELVADCPNNPGKGKPLKPPLKDKGDDDFLRQMGIDPS